MIRGSRRPGLRCQVSWLSSLVARCDQRPLTDDRTRREIAATPLSRRGFGWHARRDSNPNLLIRRSPSGGPHGAGRGTPPRNCMPRSASRSVPRPFSLPRQQRHPKRSWRPRQSPRSPHLAWILSRRGQRWRGPRPRPGSSPPARTAGSSMPSSSGNTASHDGDPS